MQEMITQGKFFGLEVVESKETREIDVSGRCENRKLDNQL